MPRHTQKGPEACEQQAILDWLTAVGIFHIRRNTGAMKTETSFVRFGVAGEADIQAFPVIRRIVHVLWIEVKSETGRQSADQKAFEKCVEDVGMHYIAVRSLESVEQYLAQYMGWTR